MDIATARKFKPENEMNILVSESRGTAFAHAMGTKIEITAVENGMNIIEQR